MMKPPAMGEIQIMSPPCLKGQDSSPGGHPEAENVPPPGTHTVTNGDDAAATSRLGMSPLKMSVSNEGRLATPNHKGGSLPSPAACALRKPVLILRRLDPKKMRRKSDILQMGLNKACAKRIRLELARCKRNCRRKYLRKMRRMAMNKGSPKGRTQSPRTPRTKRRRAAGEEAAAGNPVLDGAAADAAFTSPSKKRSKAMPNLASAPASSQLTVLPQLHGWPSHHLQPQANLSLTNLTNGAASSYIDPFPEVKKESYKSKLHQKWYESTAAPSSPTLFPPSLIPHHRLPPQPGVSSQVNGVPRSTDQAGMHTHLAVTDFQGAAQPSREPVVGMPRPPPLIPLPRVEAPGISHSNIPPGTPASRWLPHEAANSNLKSVLPYTAEPPRDASLQGHYLDPRAATQPPGGQRTTVYAVRMKTADPTHNPMVLIPTSMSHMVHNTVPAIHQNQQHHQAAQIAQQRSALPPPVSSRVVARTGTVPSNTIWIMEGQQSSGLPFAPASQSSRPTLQHHISASPSTTAPSSQHTSVSSRPEVPQDLSISSSSVITQPTPSSVTSVVRKGVVNGALPGSSSQLSLLLTAGVPLVPVSSSQVITSAHNTSTTITTRAPVVSTVPLQASENEGDDSVIYETKKSRAVKSRKQKFLESDEVLNGQVKRVKMENEVEDTLRADSYTSESCTPPVKEASLEDPLHISATTTANTLPSQEPSTIPTTTQSPVSVLKQNTASGDHPEVRNKANYVAVISITPPATATITTTMPSTITPAIQTTYSTSVPSQLIVNIKAEKSHGKDLPNGAVSPSTKESSLASVSGQDSSTKTPFILVPKKRLRVLMEPEQSSIKGTPISVVKQLRDPSEVVKEKEPLPRSSIIHTTTSALKDSLSRMGESGQSLKKPQDKKVLSPSTTTTSSASSSPTTVILKLDTATAATTVATTADINTTTTREPTERKEGAVSAIETITTPPPTASQTSPSANKQLKKLVVQVERLTEKSFTDAFLATHNVSAACGARLCRHLKVLQGAGQYHRPLNRRRLPVLKARTAAPSPEIPRPPPPRPAEAPRASPDSTPSPISSSPPSRSQSPPESMRPRPPRPKPPCPKLPHPKPLLPMAPAKISEAAGILHINSLKRRRLIVFRNKRLQPDHLKFLLDLGLDLAKKASRNSTLDGMGARGAILDPGYFGIKGVSRPSQSQRQPSQESQVPGVSGQAQHSQEAPTLVPPGLAQPTISLPGGNVFMLQQQQKQKQKQKQLQQKQKQHPGKIPTARMSVRAGVAPPVLRAAGVPHSASSAVLVQAMGHPQGTKFVMVNQQGHHREAFANPVPHGYGHYPTPPPRPEGWTSRPQASRDSLAPPLMFMGPLGMGPVPREQIQQPRIQPAVARPPPSRAVPPPLSFMGHSADSNSWAGAQHSQQSAGMSWPRLVDHTPRTYPVINHTKHVIPNKPPPAYFGPPPQYTPKSPYNIQQMVFQGQPNPNTTTAVAPRPNPNNHYLALEWQATAVPQSNPNPQEHPQRITTTAVCHPPQVSVPQRSSEQPGRTQQAARVVQGNPATTSLQQAADPVLRPVSSTIAAAISTTTTTTTTTITTPSTSTASADDHQCRQTWLPEVMAVVEALLLQLVDAGLPTRESFITHTVKQLLYARSSTVVSPLFCCPAQEKRWYHEFYNNHIQHLKAQEKVKQVMPGLSRDEVRTWLTKLKVDMVKFHGVPPQRIYYLHELNFYLDQQTREVKYHRMFPGPPMVSPGSKDTISVLFTLGADGQVGPGMIIFPRMVIPERLFESLRRVAGGRDWVLGSSANGWLTRDCVLEFVSDVFVPWLRRRAIHFPAALYSSEYISGVSVVPVADRFAAQGVQLISVPREVAGVLSPAEWIMGYRLRWHWGRVVREWSDSHDNKPLLEENFAPFIIGFLTSRATPNKVSEKFAKFGICPFDPQAMFYFLLKYHSMSTKGDKGRLQNGS